MPEALSELSRQTHISIGTAGGLPAVRTRAVRGRFTPAQALQRMLAGSRVEARQVSADAWRIVPRAIPVPLPASASRAKRADLPAENHDPVAILVTATKQPEDWVNAPRSIAVMQIDDIAQADAESSTGAVAQKLTGITLAGGGAGRNLMFLRGVSDSPFGGLNQSTVAVLLDGVRMTYSAPDPDLRLVDVKRVEVLKGPQGSLYGVGVLGGIYQIISNPADVYQTSAKVGISGSEIEGGPLGGGGSVVFNQPIVPDVAALRVVAYGSHKGGWVHTGSRLDANAVDTYGGRLNLGLELGSGWRLDAKAMVQRMKVGDSQYVYSAGARSRPDQYPEPHENDLDHAALSLNGVVGGVDIVVHSGKTWQRTTDQRDATIGADGFGFDSPRLYSDHRHYTIWDSELHASSQWGALTWLLGLSHVEANRTMDRRLWDSDPATGLRVDTGDRTSTDSALFGNLTLNLGSGFALQGGGRLFRSTLHEDRVLEGASNTLALRETGVSPEAALMWSLPDRRVLYARYGSAFRLGGLLVTSPLFDDDCEEEGDCGEIEAAKGDKLKTIEAGWRERFGGGGALDLSAYYTTWKNVQSDFLTSNGLTQSGNVGDARIIGAELTFNLPIGPWRLGLGGTYQDARLVNIAFAADDAETGRLPIVPEYTGQASLQHDLELGGGRGWLRATLRYVGPSRLSFDPVLDRAMGNYFDAGIEGRIAFGHFRFGLDIENILGGSGDTFAMGNQFRAPTMHQYTPQVPASVSVKVMADF